MDDNESRIEEIAKKILEDDTVSSLSNVLRNMSIDLWTRTALTSVKEAIEKERKVDG